MLGLFVTNGESIGEKTVTFESNEIKAKVLVSVELLNGSVTLLFDYLS